MSIAVDVSARCNCRKTVVGCVLAREGRIVGTGYNGTIVGYPNCIDGGCPRCADPDAVSGEQLDRCICVHAEQNALLAAARFGVELQGAECWVTTEPCLDCTKSLIQARLGKVVYWREYVLPRPESQQLRTDMREHARGTTEFEQWVPDSDVMNLGPRYQDVRDRLAAYVARNVGDLPRDAPPPVVS